MDESYAAAGGMFSNASPVTIIQMFHQVFFLIEGLHMQMRVRAAERGHKICKLTNSQRL